jgi:hypothetical protein
MKLLREIITAGKVINRNEWGVSKMPVCCLYYDLILRHYGHGAGDEQIFYLENFRPPPEPADTYWLLLDEKERFALQFAKPDGFPPVLDEAHFGKLH